MKRAIVIIGAVVAVLVAGCGGAHHSGPTTFSHFADWLEEEEGECGKVVGEVTRLPVSKSQAKNVPPVNLRFKRASVAAVADCGGPNGYISYYKFPSTETRAEAVRGSEGLISNELFCVAGPELVVNGLLGYDSTAPFCKRLGFKIHRPTRRYSPAQKLEHRLEDRAASLVGHLTGVPTTNIFCRHIGELFKFECQDIIGAEITEVELVKKGGRYVIKGQPRSRRPTR